MNEKIGSSLKIRSNDKSREKINMKGNNNKKETTYQRVGACKKRQKKQNIVSSNIKSKLRNPPLKDEIISQNEHSIDTMSDMNIIKNLKSDVEQLEIEKETIEKEMIVLRKKIHNKKHENLDKKLISLVKEREDAKNSANEYLNLCSELADEVIVLRNQLDNISHYKR